MSTPRTTPTRPPRKVRFLRVEGPFPPGRLVPMPPAPGPRPKAQAWHNWHVDPETGRPVGVPFTAEVPDITHYRELIAAGLLREVQTALPLPTAEPRAVKEKTP